MDKVAVPKSLKYVLDNTKGFTRQKRGHGFVYLDEKMNVIKNKKHLARIKALVIPPAWQKVWICPLAEGHLQATGYDVRGRKQYRYHADWNKHRNENKFSRLVAFANKLPEIRKSIRRDLNSEGMSKAKVLSAVVRIMDMTMIRIGNDEYAKQNGSYGLTTILNRHAKIRKSKVNFQFKGKSGKIHDVTFEDPKLAKIIKKCQELPGQELFAYIDQDTGEVFDVTSQDVNDYLKQITGEDITAKDFRTWGGTVKAAAIVRQFEPCETKTELKKRIVETVKSTAEHLRNTPAICRKYYVHPCVFEHYEKGKLHQLVVKCKRRRSAGLSADEHFALQMLTA